MAGNKSRIEAPFGFVLAIWPGKDFPITVCAANRKRRHIANVSLRQTVRGAVIGEPAAIEPTQRTAHLPPPLRRFQLAHDKNMTTELSYLDLIDGAFRLRKRLAARSARAPEGI